MGVCEGYLYNPVGHLFATVRSSYNAVLQQFQQLGELAKVGRRS